MSYYMQNLNYMKWFTHVLENLGATPPVTECAVVPPRSIQLKISFDIPVRGPITSGWLSDPVPMVSIAEWGDPSPNRTTYERTAVQKCLAALSANWYFVPDYSYFLIKALEAGESVTTAAERLCRLNQIDMVCIRSGIEISLS